MWDGLMGFLPGRAPILGKLGIGELKLEFDGAAKKGAGSYFIDGGVLQMAEGELTILAERAGPTSELNAADVEAQLAKIESDRPSVDDPAYEVKKRRRDREIKSANEKIRLARGRKLA